MNRAALKGRRIRGFAPGSRIYESKKMEYLAFDCPDRGWGADPDGHYSTAMSASLTNGQFDHGAAASL